LSQTGLEPLWWALSLGACLGGNGTLIGASANVIVAGLADKNGVHISFIGFMKFAFPLMLLSIFIAMIYLLIFYF
ncbi:MAG: sodium:proton antiporter, partial [Desulfosporosinus sp.]